MRSAFIAVLTMMILGFAGASTATAGPAVPQYSTATDGSFQVAQRDRDRICCKRGGRDWWSSWRQCRRNGGVRVANRQCREDWNERWDIRWWNFTNWNNRVCCKKGRRDWWTTARDCRNAFGYQTANRECRRG
jgi:hypothetical protein